MTVENFLSIMTPARPFIIEYKGASSIFRPGEELPKIIRNAEVRKVRTKPISRQMVFEVEGRRWED